MRRTTAVIVGAGHAGLAVSHCLAEHAIDHVILERGRVASSWTTGRWDSLRLLTPNWQSRLPGFSYTGDDPDGFMSASQVAGYIADYARSFDAPVHTDTSVSSIRQAEDGFVLETSQGSWRSDAVVVASGACAKAAVPSVAGDIPGGVASFTSSTYRNPSGLPESGVLVVGAASTGIQLADEIQRSGRPVTLAVGEHVRVPRTYRGADIMRWLDATGVLDEHADDVDDVERVRSLPSFQLVGSDDHRTIDLNTLQDIGVRLVGRLAGIRDGLAMFSGSLRNVCALADLKLGRLLDTIDEWGGFGEQAERFEPTRVEKAPPLQLDLRSSEIGSVVWATGCRPDFSWLHVPVLDHKGRMRHEGGVTQVPGLYVTGMPFLRRRKSSLIDGAADDAQHVSEHLAHHLRGTAIRPRLASVDGAPAGVLGR